LLALDHAEAQCAVGFETHNFHDHSLTKFAVVVAAAERTGKAKVGSFRWSR
jgi:hypothetical protein